VTPIAIISGDERLVEQLRACGADPARFAPSDLDGSPRLRQAPPALVLDIRRSGEVPAGLSAFCRQHPACRVAVVMTTLDPALMLEAMRAGVSECIAEPITGQVLEQALQRLVALEPPATAGQVIAFVGAKGGVGTTTLAVNTATALARATKADVLLIDLHVGHGDAALYLGAEPRFSVRDALANVHKVDASFFAGLVERSASGVNLLSSGTSPSPERTDENRLRQLLDAGARMYGVTVLDVPRFDPGSLNTLDAATTIVVVTTHDLASLRSAGDVAKTLRQRYGSARVKVVLNRLDRESMITREDVDRAAGGSLAHQIPSDYRAAVEALNAGRPLVLNPDSRVGASMTALARELAGVANDRPKKQTGILTRFVLRRA